MPNSFLRTASFGGFFVLLLFAAPDPFFAAERVEIAVELARLAKEHGFVVQGLDRTEEAFGRVDGEKLYPRLRLLLENFDHVIVQRPEGGVDLVIVLGEKVPFEPISPPAHSGAPAPSVAGGGDIVVETERQGTKHVVRVSLEGGNGKKVERELHVDTGADYLVLPQSVIPELEIDEQDLALRDMQTANGKVKARVGILPALWLSGSRIPDVETAFIDDKRLGSTGLLGMSVLRRYKLTIDDDKNRITLGSKAGETTEETAAKGGESEEKRGVGSGHSGRR